MKDFQYLRKSTDSEQRLWLSLPPLFTEPDLSPANLLQKLNQALTAAAEDSALTGIIIHAADLDRSSQKQTTFVRGNFSDLPSVEQIQHITTRLQESGELLTTLNVPSVLILDGLAPLYRLALAMAARYCIASDANDNPLAFTEARFGFHPNALSTRSAIQRMGTDEAMDYLLTGAALSPLVAAKKGLIDACVDATTLHETAKSLLDHNPSPKRAGLIKQQLRNAPLIRQLADMNLSDKVRRIGQADHYPAPYALLRLWKKHGLSDTPVTQAGYTASIAELLQSSQAANLTRVEKLAQRLRQTSTHSGQNTLKHIHLIGSGMTTGDIATYLLLQGLKITVQDKQAEAIDKTMELIRHNLTQHFAYRDSQIMTIMTNLSSDPGGAGIKKAGMVLVTKGLNLVDSQEIFADLEERAQPDTLLATHSTTLTLKKIAAAMLNPQRLLGIHFCYPAFKTELTEISFSAKTDVKLLERSLRTLRQLDKMPLPMQNSPGLLIDRILVQYILQGVRLQQQGVPHTVIDRAGRDSSMPDGPLELADKIGLDYCLRLAEVLEKAGKIEIPYQLIDMVRTGKLGIKSGSGFYRYRNGNRLKPERVEWHGSRQALQEKLTGQIREEASICLEEGLLEDPDLIDAGITFGIGFAPYLGGPLHHQRNRNLVHKRA